MVTLPLCVCAHAAASSATPTTPHIILDTAFRSSATLMAPLTVTSSPPSLAPGPVTLPEIDPLGIRELQPDWPGGAGHRTDPVVLGSVLHFLNLIATTAHAAIQTALVKDLVGASGPVAVPSAHGDHRLLGAC